MTYLELAQRLRQEAGISGDGPSSVVGQTGEMLRVVEWIAAAYEFIQNKHASWRFLRENFDFSTIQGTQEYTPTAIGVTDLGSWVWDDMRIYENESDEQEIIFVPWPAFRSSYQIGAHRSTQGRPSVFSIKPGNNAIVLWQLPDSADYTVDGEYYKTADVMVVANASEPIIPDRFHMAIVWKGLMYYGAWAGAEEKYAHGENEFNAAFAELEFDQLEVMTYGEPLV